MISSNEHIQKKQSKGTMGSKQYRTQAVGEKQTTGVKKYFKGD